MNDIQLIQKVVTYERNLALEAAARRDRHSMSFTGPQPQSASGQSTPRRRRTLRQRAHRRAVPDACQEGSAR